MIKDFLAVKVDPKTKELYNVCNDYLKALIALSECDNQQNKQNADEKYREWEKLNGS